jgi:hypothetical protein
MILMTQPVASPTPAALTPENDPSQRGRDFRTCVELANKTKPEVLQNPPEQNSESVGLVERATSAVSHFVTQAIAGMSHQNDINECQERYDNSR